LTIREILSALPNGAFVTGSFDQRHTTIFSYRSQQNERISINAIIFPLPGR